MAVSLAFCRRLLITSAALLVVVALVVAVAVIPPVRADTFPRGTPQRAANAFGVTAAYNVLAGIVLFAIGLRATGRRLVVTIVLSVLAFLTLFLVILHTDSAFAFQSHGPAMHTVSVLLFICAGADLLAWTLMVTSLFLFPKKPEGA